uniref:Uncharacterized protein n=1 Tax=viral metagenome TaxID=1070528 RepID=A0A6C0CRU9_9ZZZZ
MSGFSVPGTLSVTMDTLDDASTHALVPTVSAQQFTTTRTTANPTQSYTYFIEVEFNVNASITYVNDAIVPGSDDSWAIAHDIVLDPTNLDIVSTTLFLPTASNINVPAGVITGKDVDGSTLGTYAVNMLVDLDGAGNMTAIAEVVGSDLIASTNENLLEAQMVKFMIGDNRDTNTFLPALTPLSADSLTDTLTASDIETDSLVIQPLINSMLTNYNGINMVSTWQLVMQSIPQTTDSILSQYARHKKIPEGEMNVFSVGEKIVIDTPVNYNVELTDYLGNAVTIAQGDIYGVIKQAPF